MNFEEPGATDGSGAQYINLGYLANTRDNSRQAVMDQLNLNASLASINQAVDAITPVGLDLDRVYVVGQSLGGILATVYVTVNELAIANDGQAGLAANLTPVRGLVAAAAGTQVSQILVNSETFGPVIDGGLAAAGVEPGTSNYERFLYAAQSTVDSGDPVNFASTLAALDMPVLLVQINGDTVIPNSADSAPLAGTAPMAELLGAEPLSVGATQLGQGFVRMTAGGHSSLLRPEGGAPQVTGEMHAQVVSFVLQDAEVVVGQVAPDNIE
jgi:pimeloyl-ACP methyl ester carboxylesterase